MPEIARMIPDLLCLDAIEKREREILKYSSTPY